MVTFLSSGNQSRFSKGEVFVKFNVFSHATYLRVALSTTAAVLALAISPASAAVVYNTDLADPPGVYYGIGNANGNFVVDTENGVEIGFRAKLYKVGNITPTGNLYQVSTGLYNPCPCRKPHPAGG
jgi:hypothetical protein